VHFSAAVAGRRTFIVFPRFVAHETIIFSGKWNLAGDYLEYHYYYSSARFYETGVDDFGCVSCATNQGVDNLRIAGGHGDIIAAALAELVRVSRYKGINLVAYAFIGSGVLCLLIDGVLSFYLEHEVHLWWSVIVAICALLVAIVLMFLHFRLKKGRSLEKTFHI
jgi:hypothetical protein